MGWCVSRLGFLGEKKGISTSIKSGRGLRCPIAYLLDFYLGPPYARSVFHFCPAIPHFLTLQLFITFCNRVRLHVVRTTTIIWLSVLSEMCIVLSRLVHPLAEALSVDCYSVWGSRPAHWVHPREWADSSSPNTFLRAL